MKSLIKKIIIGTVLIGINYSYAQDGNLLPPEKEKDEYALTVEERDLLDKTLKIIRKVTLWGRDLLRKLMLRDG